MPTSNETTNDTPENQTEQEVTNSALSDEILEQFLIQLKIPFGERKPLPKIQNTMKKYPEIKSYVIYYECEFNAILEGQQGEYFVKNILPNQY